MKFGNSDKSKVTSDNVLTMHADLYSVSELDAFSLPSESNVVAINSGPVIGVLEYDGRVTVAVEEASISDVDSEDNAPGQDSAPDACMNGVCSISWKPRRPTAA